MIQYFRLSITYNTTMTQCKNKLCCEEVESCAGCLSANENFPLVGAMLPEIELEVYHNEEIKKVNWDTASKKCIDYYAKVLCDRC